MPSLDPREEAEQDRTKWHDQRRIDSCTRGAIQGRWREVQPYRLARWGRVRISKSWPAQNGECAWLVAFNCTRKSPASVQETYPRAMHRHRRPRLRCFIPTCSTRCAVTAATDAYTTIKSMSGELKATQGGWI